MVQTWNVRLLQRFRKTFLSWKTSSQGTFIHLLESKVSVGCFFLGVLFVELIGEIKTIVFRQNTNKYNKVVKKKKSRFSTETKFNLPVSCEQQYLAELTCCVVRLNYISWFNLKCHQKSGQQQINLFTTEEGHHHKIFFII